MRSLIARYRWRRAGTRRYAAAATLLLLAACGGNDAAPAMDSSLARDLALANVVTQPQFNDAPIGESPEPARPAPQADPAPVTPRSSAAGRERSTPRRTSPPPAERPRASTAARTPVPVPERTPNDAPAPRPEAAPAPTPAPERAGFAAGTRLALATGAQVCTVSGRPGDKIVATLREPVRGRGGAVIPAGATVVLEVASVESGDPVESGRITFRVRSLDIHEQAHAARGSATVVGNLERQPVRRVNASDRKRVIGGAVIGAIAGRMIEGGTRGAVIGAAAGGAAGAISARGDQQFEGCLPAGSAVAVTLDEALDIS